VSDRYTPINDAPVASAYSYRVVAKCKCRDRNHEFVVARIEDDRIYVVISGVEHSMTWFGSVRGQYSY